ncbi:unnamed protein product [Mycena citricolor]|uniref:Uncharacterized protein n=1 Tax=Mycena citricolor TaxID=2018698 RepID=A0AAD2HRD8_9AGAR|nr:unnamed protein product [Mycena citricolor]
MFVAMASYSRQKAASHSNTVYDYNVKSGILLQTFLSICLTIYMWATIETFGSLPQCSHLVTFMVFVIKVPALQPGKIIGLTASSVLLVMYTSISLHELFASVRRRRVKALIPHHLRTSTPRHSTLPTVQTPTTPAAVPSASLRRPPSLANISVVPRTATQTSILSPTEIVSLSSASGPSQSVLKRRPRRTQWSREVDPMFIGVVICQVLVFTYFIVSSELLLTNNYGAQDAAQQMGFGQVRRAFLIGYIITTHRSLSPKISALIVILPGALAVIGAVREHGFKRLSKRKRSNTRLRSRRNTNV